MPRHNKAGGKGANGGNGQGDQSQQTQHINGLPVNQQPQLPAMQNTQGVQNSTGVSLGASVINTQELLGQTRDILYGQNQGPFNINNNNNNMVDGGGANGCVNPTAHVHSRIGQDHGQSYLLNAGTSSGIHQSHVNQPLAPNYYTHSGAQPVMGPTMDSSIPTWAAALCQQISNIQSSIENQNTKWQTMAGSINTQNDRLTKIETQLTEIGSVKTSVAKTNTELTKIQSEVRNLKTKITDFDSNVQEYSDICDDITSANDAFESRLNQIDRRMNRIEKQQEEILERQDKTDERSVDTQWRTMRENLIFSGIPETDSHTFKEYGENCEEKIKSIIKNEMKVDREISFDRVHRIGRFNRNHHYPRPIVAKFTYYKDRECIRKLAYTTLEGTQYYVKEQFPYEIESERKLLYGPAKEARENKENKVRLVKNKLFINGKRYIPQERVSNNKNENARHNQSSNQTYRTNTNTTANREVNSRWSRTFTRSRYTEPSRETDTALPLRNSFAALSSAAITDNATPMRQSHAGKSKAKSPLEQTDSFKKHKQEEDSNQSDSGESTTSTVYIRDTESQMDTQPPEDIQEQEAEQTGDTATSDAPAYTK